ncbi:winged helix-turn-helix domain-containing protein [Ornithinimicrobium cerasi]|uniref:Transcriptional regulator, ArsR family n=1 Tax=Ornithinimicrobium cerasi TaxID=2248773 RepID=A0A285VSI1_9MICO|nr:winged helix-turn-helix domain-containing protein [Ornithinimicrobium cerasi]SOC56827.1 transcriptional regulator, ArsR family [Ornithinimicrobium cerasi]
MASEDPRTVRLTSPMLKAVSHPLRRRILELMHEDVPRRAADLAELVGAPANSVSFHLRQLAGAGLIVEAPEHARDRRDRVWMAAGSGYTIPTPPTPASPEDELVLRSFMDQEALDLHDLVARVTAWAPDWGSGRDTTPRAAIQTGLVELTQEDVRWLSDTLQEVMSQAVERSRRPAEEPRRLWRLVAILADDSLPAPGETTPDPQETTRDA